MPSALEKKRHLYYSLGHKSGHELTKTLRTISSDGILRKTKIGQFFLSRTVCQYCARPFHKSFGLNQHLRSLHWEEVRRSARKANYVSDEAKDQDLDDQDKFNEDFDELSDIEEEPLCVDISRSPRKRRKRSSSIKGISLPLDQWRPILKLPEFSGCRVVVKDIYQYPNQTSFALPPKPVRFVYDIDSDDDDILPLDPLDLETSDESIGSPVETRNTALNDSIIIEDESVIKDSELSCEVPLSDCFDNVKRIEDEFDVVVLDSPEKRKETPKKLSETLESSTAVSPKSSTPVTPKSSTPITPRKKTPKKLFDSPGELVEVSPSPKKDEHLVVVNSSEDDVQCVTLSEDEEDVQDVTSPDVNQNKKPKTLADICGYFHHDSSPPTQLKVHRSPLYE